MTEQRRYGWKKDRPDGHVLMSVPRLGIVFPPEFSLRSAMPDAYDQGQTMGCTGNAIAAILQYDRRTDGLEDWTPSRKFPYYNGRKREGWEAEDQGAMICDVVDSLSDCGYCAESSCPYEEMDEAPSEESYLEGLGNLITGRLKLPQNEEAFKSALMAGRPILCGMLVFSKFETAEMAASATLRIPEWGEQQLGGHCICIIGWKNDFWEIRNSWGAKWGDKGNFWADRDYFLRSDLSSDFTVIPKA